MNNLNIDQQNLDAILTEVKQQGIDYLNHIHERSTANTADVVTIHYLKQEGTGAVEALKQFNERFEPIMVASSGPRYWGLSLIHI